MTAKHFYARCLQVFLKRNILANSSGLSILEIDHFDSDLWEVGEGILLDTYANGTFIAALFSGLRFCKNRRDLVAI